MMFLECLKYAAEALSLDKIREGLESGELDGLTGNERNELDALMRCAYAAATEVLTEYAAAVCIEDVDLTDGTVRFKNLKNKVVNVIAVYKDGEKAGFKADYEKAAVKASGKVRVEYSFVPPYNGIETEIPFCSEQFSGRLLSYGAVCEYLLRSGDTQEAALWDKRYKDALATALRPKREIKIKPRRWF